MTRITQQVELEPLARDLADRPVWGVVCEFALCLFRPGMTLSEAEEFAREEAEREPGRTTHVVLLARTLEGHPHDGLNA